MIEDDPDSLRLSPIILTISPVHRKRFGIDACAPAQGGKSSRLRLHCGAPRVGAQARAPSLPATARVRLKLIHESSPKISVLLLLSIVVLSAITAVELLRCFAL
jgi:hypothetical protein